MESAIRRFVDDPFVRVVLVLAVGMLVWALRQAERIDAPRREARRARIEREMPTGPLTPQQIAEFEDLGSPGGDARVYWAIRSYLWKSSRHFAQLHFDFPSLEDADDATWTRFYGVAVQHFWERFFEDEADPDLVEEHAPAFIRLTRTALEEDKSLETAYHVAVLHFMSATL